MSSKNCTTSPSLSRYRYLRCAGRRSPKIDDSLYTVAPRKLCANLRLKAESLIAQYGIMTQKCRTGQGASEDS